LTLDPSLFISRELSWLAFDERVLEEAADPANPLLERLKFAAIASSNLDEFFMVRVAAVQRAVEDEDPATDPSGLTPREELSAIRHRSHRLVASLYQVVNDELMPALRAAGIRVLAMSELDEPKRASLGRFFRDAVLPVLTPLAIDVSRPFPLLSSLTLNLALLLDGSGSDGERRFAIVQVPSVLTRLVEVAGGDGLPAVAHSAKEGRTFVLLEDVIRAHLGLLFPGQTILESTIIRLARDAELELDDEGGRTHLERVEREVRRRRLSDVVRLEVEASGSEDLLALLREQLDVTDEEVYAIPGMLDLRVLLPLTDLPGFDELRDPPLQPASVLAEHEQRDLFEVLDERDVLLHHPYDSYDPVIALIARAADDPDVLAIKQTLYRTSTGSPIIAALQRAAECNKQVTVLVELTARFDEERNIQWARALEQAGAHVIYGVRRYKTHAKICLVVRRTPQGLRRYVHLGTGNYNERTARVYTDFALMTASLPIAEDATAFFSALTGYSDAPRFKKLVMAPTQLRPRFLKLIERERRRAEAGQPAEIVAKMNSLVDEDIVAALYKASQAGVVIRLNVRGICTLRPGLPGVSETIEVISIVDRFLEHARVYYFRNGGDEQVYLASADWMSRNLDKRVELMFPVENPAHKASVLYALRAMFRDNVRARRLRPDGSYERKKRARGEQPFRVQQHLQEEARRRMALARERAGATFSPEEGQ
jgi:polyphosphate kinase